MGCWPWGRTESDVTKATLQQQQQSSSQVTIKPSRRSAGSDKGVKEKYTEEDEGLSQ